MTRERIGLDGSWQFCFAGDDFLIPTASAAWRIAVVPGPWQSQFDDLRMSSGVAWYRRHVRVPANWRGHRMLLRFGAVSYHAVVYVNGHVVGEHEGGWLPFEFDITPHVNFGISNDILVRVVLPSDDPETFPDFPLSEVPFGKQSWYGPLGGLWQSVVLERRAPVHMTALRVRPQAGDGCVDVRVSFNRSLIAPMQLVLTVEDAGNVAVASSTTVVPAGAAQADVTLQVAEPRLWSPDSPNLYNLTATLRADEGGGARDRISDRFGFRTIETRDGRLYLNGEPIFLRGALDQDYYPDGICTPPSLDFLEDQLLKAKQLGLNCLRCHIKAPDPRYYEVADRLGMLIWSELPNSGLVTPQSRARAEETLKGIIERDGNHPSIICWTIVNENWGVDLVHDADHRAWVKRMYAWIKANDPGRLVVDNSPIAPSLHVQTDIEDFHFYAAMPDHRRDWDRFIDAFAQRPSWTFSGNGDAERIGDEPLMVSEFGTWGLPDPAQLAGSDGREPWWFETGHDWGDGVMYPHGMEKRFRDWHLDRPFGSLRNLVEATQAQQFLGLKYQIESIRRKPQLAGYVLTEFTDCHWECNGLLDMRRNPRVFHDILQSVNADTVIVPEWQRLACWSGEKLSLGVAIAHGAGPALLGTFLRASLGEVVIERPVPDTPAGTVVDLGPIALPIPAAATARTLGVLLTLHSAEGEILTANRVAVAVHPRRDSERDGRPLLWSAAPQIRGRLAALGYPLASTMDDAQLVVGDGQDGDTFEHVQQGGRFLLLADAPMAVDRFFPNWQNVQVRSRQGTPWQGDWASSFSWVRREGALAELPGPVLIDHAFDRVIPRHVIAGCNRLDFQSRVHAGVFVGWIHKPAALIVERSYGLGRIVISTFRLFEDPPGVDPTATTLLDGLITLAVTERPARDVEIPGAGERPRRVA